MATGRLTEYGFSPQAIMLSCQFLAQVRGQIGNSVKRPTVFLMHLGKKGVEKWCSHLELKAYESKLS